ncbi:MAG: heavy-metal-associated domain-containing protein [Candidatus Levybacteria bacterium]|nr:heavy-metal-associated domain-containing protein [Candidatus Levybacteria bacterium]
MKKITLKIIGMHCTSCTMNIDGELEDTTGVKEANTSYAKSITEVTFDEGKLTEENIIEIIQKVGYSAQLQE